MCRSAFYCKSHWVCLPCQLSFKREGNWRLESPDQAVATVFRCSNCREPLEIVGRDFRVPKRRDQEAWETLRTLIANDYRAFSRCCMGPGPYPRRLRDVPDFLESRREKSPGEQLAERFLTRSAKRSQSLGRYFR
ncbi:MAG: hypothetical protein P1V97_24785 [Planctomycetota bacterium]|nr:hypothetical protein [Planctomycetota bacterium]